MEIVRQKSWGLVGNVFGLILEPSKGSREVQLDKINESKSRVIG